MENDSIRYNLVGAIVILSLVLGEFLFPFKFFGVEVYAFRVLLAGAFAYTLYSKKLRFYNSSFSRYIFYFLTIWLVYAIIGLSWAPSLYEGAREVLYLQIGWVIYVTIFSWYTPNDSIKWMDTWLLIFLILSIGVCIEIGLNWHVQGSFWDKLVDLGPLHPSWSTSALFFDNPNLFALYLVITVAVISWKYLESNSKSYAVMLLLAVSLITMTSSLFGLISIGCMFLLFALTILLSKGPYSKLLLYCVAVSIPLLASYFDANQKKNSPLNDIVVVANPSDASPHEVYQINEDKITSYVNDEIMIEFVDASKLDKASFWNRLEYPWLLGIITLSIFLLSIHFAYKNIEYKMNYILLIGGIGIVSTLLYINRGVWDEKQSHQLSMSKVESSIPAKISVSKNALAMIHAGKSVTILKKQDLVPSAKSSENIRRNLALNGWELTKASNFLGTGPGGFKVYHKEGKVSHSTGTIINPHSLFVEVLAQYGLLIFIGLICAMGWCAFILIQSLFKREWSSNSFLVGCLFITLIFMGNANSSFLPLPLGWILVALVFVETNRLTQSNNSEH